jgi:acyl-CoA synthetase (NDP forming)
MDLTLGDYLTYLKDDKDIEVFSIYLEGFKPLDGAKFLKAAKEITESGRSIIFYSSGKTAEGAKAMASHTASIAGDYAVTRELCERAGIVLADNFEDFEDLTRTFVFLKDKTVSGNRLGVVSNAGCECVAASDNLGEFKLSEFTADTNGRLENVFKEARIDAIVDVHNPVDLTPMAGDAAYEETIRTVMNDKNVDFGVMACIPLAPTLNALEKAEGHREDLMSDKSVVQRMMKLHKELKKAWVAVVDAGPLFDPMVRLFEENGIPTFRTIDKALRLSNLFLKYKK